MEFNNATSYSGVIQHYESENGYEYGDVSGNTELLKQVTAKINLARRRYFSLAIQSSGTWELDDNLHADYSVIYATITSGQKDYSFVRDENGNIILDIYKVLILPDATATEYVELDPVDENQPENIDIINEGNQTGTPTKYSKRSNSVFFNNTPNYTVARGIKILINREPSYYTYTDTTKLTGFPYYPEYFYLRPSFERAGKLGLSTLPHLQKRILELEGDDQNRVVGLIQKAYGRRQKDIVDNFSGESINSI